MIPSDFLENSKALCSTLHDLSNLIREVEKFQKLALYKTLNTLSREAEAVVTSSSNDQIQMLQETLQKISKEAKVVQQKLIHKELKLSKEELTAIRELKQSLDQLQNNISSFTTETTKHYQSQLSIVKENVEKILRSKLAREVVNSSEEFRQSFETISKILPEENFLSVLKNALKLTLLKVEFCINPSTIKESTESYINALEMLNESFVKLPGKDVPCLDVSDLIKTLNVLEHTFAYLAICALPQEDIHQNIKKEEQIKSSDANMANGKDEKLDDQKQKEKKKVKSKKSPSPTKQVSIEVDIKKEENNKAENGLTYNAEVCSKQTKENQIERSEIEMKEDKKKTRKSSVKVDSLNENQASAKKERSTPDKETKETSPDTKTKTSESETAKVQKEQKSPLQTCEPTVQNDINEQHKLNEDTSQQQEKQKDYRDLQDSLGKPYFVTKLNDLNVSDTTRIKLTCAALGAKPLDVKWFKDGSPVVNNEKYKIYSSDSLFTLEVLNTNVQDSAEYTCIVNNKYGYCTTKSNLNVMKGFEALTLPPTFTRSITDAYDIDKNELVLECRVRAQPFPAITWFKNRSKVEPDDRQMTHYLADGICRLVIKAPTKSDTGLYVCKAENAEWKDQISHHVEFEGNAQNVTKHSPLETPGVQAVLRPVLSGVLTHNFVPSGGTWALQVEVKGSPMVVTWYKDDQALPRTSTKHKTFTESGVYSLMFDNATNIDSGKYIFTASNLYGHIQTSAYLHVVDPFLIRGGKPPLFKSRPEKVMSVRTGDDIVVSFRISGDPKPKVTWMKGLQDITNDYRAMRETSDDYMRLTLKRAREEDMGTYCILAKNRYGCDRSFFTVFLRERLTSPDTQTCQSILQNIANYHERRYFTDVPGPVFGVPLVTNSGRNWLSLSWNKPQHKGAAPVVAYRVDLWLPGGEGARWKQLGITGSTNFDVFNLCPNGEYQFRITPKNRYGWGESVQTNLFALGDCAGFPEFTQNLPGQMKGLLGSHLSLQCEVREEPDLYIKWCHNGKEIKEYEMRYEIAYENNTCTLTIHDIEDSDSGSFMCEASNKTGRASTFTRLYVVDDPKILKADTDLKFLQVNVTTAEAPPQFLMRLRDRRVETSYPVRLTCQVTGHPVPEIEWSRDGHKISEDHRHKFLQENYFYTLEIDKTTLEDSGTYTATARNIFGSVSCHCKLIVDKGIRAYVVPEFSSKLEPELITIVEGKELQLSARVKAYPAVTVLWYRNGVRLRPNRKTIMSLTHDGRINFSLKETKLEDAGVYTCIATNEVGRSETCVKVDVNTKDDTRENGESLSDAKKDIPYAKEPKFLKKPRSSEACEGDNIIICCEVVGDPKPEVIWLRDFLKPDYYRDSPHFLRIGDGPEYRLEIPEAKLDFTGTYTVIAKNCYGEAKAIISLQIKVKGTEHKNQKIFGKVQTIPKVLRELCDIRCCDGDSVTLECEVEKSLSQDIRWEKCNKLVRLSGDFISEFDGSIARLLIKKVYPEDEGEYTCVVYNDLGDARTSACLLVDVPEEKDNLLTEALSRPTDITQTSSRSPHSLSPTSYSGHTFTKIPKYKQAGPKFYSVPHHRIAEEGETVRFRCSIAGHPEPWTVWSKDGCAITPSSRIIIKEQGDLRILEISDVVPQDSGLYYVTLENSIGKAEASARLDVTSYKKYLTPALRVRGASPRPSYGKYGGGDLSYGSSSSRSERQSYTGFYTPHYRLCSNAVNFDYSDTMCATKVDWEAPSLIEELPELLKVSEGRPTQLKIRVASAKPFDVLWWKDDHLLPNCEDFDQLVFKDGCVVLNISDIFIEDCGVYSCEISNEFGQVTSECHLVINDCGNSPVLEFSKTPTAVVATCGSTASFSAQVRCDNNAKTTIVWRIGDNECTGFSNKYKVEVEDDVSTLHIFDVTHLDSGQVSCSAYLASEEISRHSPQSTEENSFSCVDNENTLCTINHITELKVLEDNSFGSECNDSVLSEASGATNTMSKDEKTTTVLLKGPKDTNALVGDRVLLKATYAGEPEPSITWTKAGKTLSNNDRIWITSGDGITCLLLENITTHDSGKYGVHVDNGNENHALYASLSVEGPPDPPQGKPSVIAGVESATVTWSSSPYDGGSIITGFALEYSLIDSNIWTVAVNNCHTLNYTVNGLESNCIYLFRVRAINIYGSSPPSLVSDHTLINPNATVVPSIITLEPQLSFQTKYKVLEEIGKGRYGVVHKIADKNSSTKLAAKIVRCRTVKDRKKIQEEIDVMNVLRHPKLLQLLAAYESQREITLVTEYISGGELFERVVADDFTLTERDCILFMRQICEGVNYMHQQNIVHLDLKPENIMCYTRTSHEIKIIDFGLAQKLNPAVPVRVLFGTAEFVSPEIINYEPIGTKSDMWSIGIICYVLLSGLSPFMGDNDAETFANITRADYDFNDEAFDAISQNARDFIGALLVKQKENRLSAKECLKHTWLDPEQHHNTVIICKEKLKKFIIRRKWQENCKIRRMA